VTEPWRPLTVRTGALEARAQHDALREDVPSWLAGNLWDFVNYMIKGSGEIDYGLLRAIERNVRVSLGEKNDVFDLYFKLRDAVHQDAGTFLNVVDYLLTRPLARDVANELDRHLLEAGSAWEVSPQADGLTRRVAPEARAAAEQVMSAGDKAAQHVAMAWEKAYGRWPDAKAAYREAVSAVEAAAIPIVVPTDTQATLGKVIGELRVQAAQFECSLQPPAPFESIAAVVGMLQLLWKGQRDRHGSPDEEVPVSVEMPEAQAAVHLAVTLVQFFTKGHVRRK
jgi:hypothetical protein